MWDEDFEYMIERLTILTDSRQIKWLCLNYEPITLMPSDNEKEAYLTQSISVISEYRNQFYYFEFDDFMDIPSGQGYMQYTFRSDFLEKQRNGIIFDFENVISKLCNSIYQSICDELVPDIDYDRLSNREFRFSILYHPFVRAARLLQKEKSIKDIHRLVLDSSFRQKQIRRL